MIPDPLHPAIIHFPIVLAVMLVPAASAAYWAIASGRLPGRSWVAIVALQAALAGSVWLAVETGEDEEERVERIVAESLIEGHEEAAERFLALAALGLPLAFAGLIAGPVGRINRILTVLLALGALASAIDTGHLGGELVYRHGAANAYTPDGAPPGEAKAARAQDHERGEYGELREGDHDDDS